MAYAGIVLTQNRKILLQLRDNKSGVLNPGTWGTFGGGIEDGETPVEAIIREVKEELDINLVAKSLNIISKGTSLKGRAFFIFKARFPTGQKITLREGQEARWFSIDEALKLSNVVPHMKDLFILLRDTF